MCCVLAKNVTDAITRDCGYCQCNDRWMQDFISKRWQTIASIFRPAWVKWAAGLWFLISTYDTIVAQFIPISWAQHAPNAYGILSVTSGYLPYWAWLLILATIVVIASLEYAFRRNPSAGVARISLVTLRDKASMQGWNFSDPNSLHIIDLCDALRQAGLDGTLRFWGKSNRDLPSDLLDGEPLVEIPAEHWKNFWIDWTALAQAQDGKLAFTYYPGGSKQEGFVDVHVSKNALGSWLKVDAAKYRGRRN